MESTVGPLMSDVPGAASILVVGKGWTKLAIRQFTRAMEAHEMLPSRAFELASGPDTELPARAMLSVEAKLAPPAGLPPDTGEEGGAGVEVPAIWMGRDSINVSAASVSAT